MIHKKIRKYIRDFTSWCLAEEPDVILRKSVNGTPLVVVTGRGTVRVTDAGVRGTFLVNAAQLMKTDAKPELIKVNAGHYDDILCSDQKHCLIKLAKELGCLS